MVGGLNFAHKPMSSLASFICESHNSVVRLLASNARSAPPTFPWVPSALPVEAQTMPVPAVLPLADKLSVPSVYPVGLRSVL